MRLHDLLGGLDVAEWTGDPNVQVTAITHDSRRVAPGACFCCIPGAMTDGHDHAAAAVAAGARALLVERILPLDVAQARFRSVRRAMGPASSRFFGDPSRDLRCLGVTGTNGKTTTTYLLEAIARAAGDRVGVIGTIGARIAGEAVAGERTTPEATELQSLLARMREAHVLTVAMEVSSHALAQHRVDGTWFTAACFTNLSHDHLDYHGTVPEYFEAKMRLFDPARVGAAAGNVDDSYGAELLKRCHDRGLSIRSFGFSAGADLTAFDVVLGAHDTQFELVDRVADRRAAIRSSLLGRFNVANALAAAATSLLAGFDFESVVAGLCEPVVVPGRLERVATSRPFTVLVDYAHAPDALQRVLDAARALTRGGRVLVVFGCGGDRDREKRPLMGGVAAGGADFTVMTSDNPRSEDPAAIVDAVAAGWRGGTPFVVELDRRAAIRRAFREARAGDVVVIAGKGHETGQTTGEETVPFDDRVVALEELEGLECG